MSFAAIWLALTLGAAPHFHPGAAPPSRFAGDLDAFAFMEGEWTAVFETFADTWGEEGAGTSNGTISGRFGPGKSWFEMEATTALAGSGSYAVKVLVYRDGRAGDFRAFVVNSFNSGATYTGAVDDTGSIVFHATIGDKIQRVTYERHGARVRYVAEESRDGGETYEPHTEAWWTRAR